MAVNAQSCWQQSARKRWPNVADVKGDGPFAVHCTCCPAGNVLLFQTAIEAQQAAVESCGHWSCYKAHTAYRLQPVAQAAPQFAHSVGYGRD
jgi:hypothetical protein